MLAKAGGLPEGDGWGFELKWDGIRALAFVRDGRLRMQSRRMEDVTFRYPELEPMTEALDGRDAILDGEVVARDDEGRPRFQLVQRRMGLTSKGAVDARRRQTPVDFVAFDLVHLDGRDLRAAPYSERRDLLAGLGFDGACWSAPAHRVGGGAELLEAAKDRGLEGVVAKKLESPYREGRRSGEWIKERIWREQEFVIGGHIPGEGRRAETVGSLLVGYYDKRASELGPGESQSLHFAGGVGSGLTQGNLAELSAALGKINRKRQPVRHAASAARRRGSRSSASRVLVCQVSWSEWTAQGTLRQPAFKAMRDDKDPREIVREQG